MSGRHLLTYLCYSIKLDVRPLLISMSLEMSTYNEGADAIRCILQWKSSNFVNKLKANVIMTA